MKPGRTTATVERLLQPSALLLVWVYLYLLALLAGWVLLASLATGYQPVVVTTGSMRPAVEPGDVLLIADPPADQMLPQRAVILFERDSGELVTHRVYAVENDEYVTKGDANPSVDLERVRPDQTLGVGRIVVPLVGLPIVWYQTQNYVALGAWIIVTLAAFVVSIRSAIAVLRSPRDRSAEAQGQPLAQRAIRRVRILVGAMIISQYVIEPSRFDIAGEAIPRGFVFGASLLGLGALTLISFRVDRSGTPQQAERFAIIELVGDTVFVIVLTAAAGTNGIGWVLFALPIVEAAARYRVSGALLHWMGLTAATLATQIALIERTDAGDGLLIDKLDQVLDQLSVLLLVVIPGAYLAEQLIGDVGNQRRATEIAQSRNAMLEGVVEVGHEINRLGSDVFEVMVAAATELGFDAADICVAVDDGAWHVVAGSATADTVVLPTPGDPASTLRVTDLSTPNVIVDSDDDDATEVGALATSGFGAIVRTTVSEQPVAVALRAAVLPHRSITSAMLDALRLLAGQATVALQNDRLVGELQTLHNELHHQANHDVLTGLPNRAQFLQRTADALDTVAAEGSTVVLFSDLNGFKPVNDQYGHDVGDELLRVIARRLSNAVGERGLVARLGGDEFTVLLEASNADDACALAARLVQVVSQPIRLGHRELSVGTSIGIAISERELRAAELLRRADVAMYGAKSDDRAAWKVYDPAMEEADRRQQWMVGELGRAIAGDGLTLDYQLVVSSRTGAPIGVEALLRWRHRDLGPIPSPEIILLAEAGNLTDALHRWIMRRACLDAVGWRQIMGDGFFVAVNASPAELESPEFVDHVRDALVETALPADALFVELSERFAIPDTAPAAHPAFQGLHDLGVRLLLDDFGEGRTSLAYLRGLPISGLKLDRLLVDNAVKSDADRIILESITQLAHALSLVVIAEGIEADAHLGAAHAAGCDYLQGYHISRPCSADVVTELLERGLPRRTSDRRGSALPSSVADPLGVSS